MPQTVVFLICITLLSLLAIKTIFMLKICKFSDETKWEKSSLYHLKLLKFVQAKVNYSYTKKQISRGLRLEKKSTLIT